MHNEEIVHKVEGLFKEYLELHGFELVELSYRYENGRNVLRLLADRPSGGITLEECSRLNRELGLLLEERDLIPEQYVLEVSSPGLDRPLRTRGDFARNSGRQIKVFLSEPINGRIEVDGTVGAVAENGFTLLREEGPLEVPLAKVNKAKLIISSGGR